MKKLLILVALLSTILANAQTGIGLGLYPTGTEPGVGIRSGKNSKWFFEASITKANFYSEPTTSSFITEASAGVRIIKLEKVFLNLGLGIRNEWNTPKSSKVGVTVPVSIEAFPFSFQNAGLFFGAAPFYSTDMHGDMYSGIRTTAGMMFYFPKKKSESHHA